MTQKLQDALVDLVKQITELVKAARTKIEQEK